MTGTLKPQGTLDEQEGSYTLQNDLLTYGLGKLSTIGRNTIFALCHMMYDS